MSLVSTYRRLDLLELLRNNYSHLSEICWEGMYTIFQTRTNLLTGNMCKDLVVDREVKYSERNHTSCTPLE